MICSICGEFTTQFYMLNHSNMINDVFVCRDCGLELAWKTQNQIFFSSLQEYFDEIEEAINITQQRVNPIRYLKGINHAIR